MSKTAPSRAAIVQDMQGLIVLLMGQAMASMDASILAVASPSLRLDLGASGGALQLIVAMYALAFGTLVVTGARLGATLGYRRAFVRGLGAFTLASLAAGLAPSAEVLVVARGFQGAAAALMTPQVLSIIQLHYEGERRARAIGAYSMILAVGVAAGQLLGGLLVSAHLLSAAWRPALLINVPVGVALLVGARRWLPRMATGDGRRLDVGGVGLLAAALLALVIPLTFGRQAGWPAWVWPSLAASVAAGTAFVALERRLILRRAQPLLDLRLLTLPGIGAGVLAVLLIMACYAGFLIALTLYVQGEPLGYSPLQAGATFAVYAAGFATASLTWSRFPPPVRDRLPILGPLVMGAALLAVGLMTSNGQWDAALSAPLLFAGGAGHAWGFSPLASRLTSSVSSANAPDMTGFILTASLVGQVIGVATFTGVYLSHATPGPAAALAVTTGVLAASLVVTAACAWAAVSPTQPGCARRSASATCER
jgi:MFS family permease